MKHCQRHGPEKDPYCVDCWKDERERDALCPSDATHCPDSSDADKYADPSKGGRYGCSQERVEEQLRIALDGHSCSELWGENGLIAATMRAARVVATLEDVIQKFRDEEEYLLLDKSSRALGGAIAYGAMADELAKLVVMPDDDTDRMRAMLARIAYPSRGTPDETADINAFAAEIQATWSLESLTENDQVDLTGDPGGPNSKKDVIAG